ncbi:GNAT family N-acetyltransferase [Bacillus sp. EB01]|uniref:GNAT family N-acetyltransferase n=1 Tax=Bacillus sp. EB01 TaxID=1347086 RepID=UPI0005C6D6C6|nr:GNAT family N-acetyltransferase [Bacillus sp. EB01]
MIKEINITRKDIAQEVLDIQLPAYMTEAKLIDFYEIPTLNDTVETLRQCGERFCGYYENGSLCGAISYKLISETVDIHRLMVHPDYFRKGIANQLLAYLEERNPDADSLVVSTGSGNTPAIRFYEKHGFQRIGERKVADNLKIALFRKDIAKADRNTPVIEKTRKDR